MTAYRFYFLYMYKLGLVKLYTPQMLVALTPALLGRDNMGNYCPVVPYQTFG